MKKTTTKIRVRYAETDQMGFVHHGNYAQFFEIGRLDWITKIENCMFAHWVHQVRNSHFCRKKFKWAKFRFCLAVWVTPSNFTHKMTSCTKFHCVPTKIQR